jgi:hypothetical protein
MSKEQLGGPVADTFVVKGKVYAPGAVLTVIGVAVAVIAGIVAGVGEGKPLIPLVIAGAGVLAAIEGIILLLGKRKRWRISLHRNGAEVQDKAGRNTEILFGELAAISHQPKPKYANGVFTGTQHILRFWRKQDPPKKPFAEIDCYVSDKKNKKEAEAMQAFGDAAGNAICERLVEIVDNGGTVKSPAGVQVNANGLRFQGTSIALGEIEDIGLFDGKFCIWRQGEEFPALKLDPAGPNLVPMMNVVKRKLAERSEQADEERKETLGRVLFERRQPKVLGWLLVVVGLPLSVVLVGIPIVLFGYGLIKGYFRCHERGVSKRGLGKEKRLFYHQVATFTYSATRMYVNGAYVGTSLTMKFETDDPKAVPPIKYNANVKNVDADLDALRELISAVVAQRLLRRYAETGSFAWTKSLEVTTDGIRYRKSRLLGKGEWAVLPFDHYLGVNVQEGTFHLFSKDAEKSIYHCAISEPNFFPGLHAFMTIVEPDEEPNLDLAEGGPEEREQQEQQ